MNDTQRRELGERNRRRAISCPKCGGQELRTVDGFMVGGLAGLLYRECPACGDARPLVRQPKRRGL
jgi:predicted RNA-binding Zn-ribbon protein involved in translation (DUF1610 family)